jgi:hypothetical protein
MATPYALQAEMDRRFASARRDLEALQALMDRTFGEREKAITLAEHEREKTATVLREFIESQITAVRRELTNAQRASEASVSKAETAATERFNTHNEVLKHADETSRALERRIAELIATFLPREVADTVFKGLETRLGALEGRTRFTQGQERGTDKARQVTVENLTLILLLVGIIVSVITHGFTR